MPVNNWVAYDSAVICPRGRNFQIKHLGLISYWLAGIIHPPLSHSIWVLLRNMVLLLLQWLTRALHWEVDAMCFVWKSPVGFLFFYIICSKPLSRSLVRFLCVFPRKLMGTSAWMTRHCLGDKLVCILENSVSIVLSPMGSFLLWSRIIQMINALVLIVMASQATREKTFMELMIFTRDQNRGLISENK